MLKNLFYEILHFYQLKKSMAYIESSRPMKAWMIKIFSLSSIQNGEFIL